VLFGDRPFTGQLSQSWPRSAAQEPINVGDANYRPLYPFGWGLTTKGTSEQVSRTEPRDITALRLRAEHLVANPVDGVPARAADAIARADVATLQRHFATARKLYRQVIGG
jgi:beta-glucosidase